MAAVVALMTWWIWLFLGLLLLVSEMLTPGGFYLMFLGISGMLVGFLMLAVPALEPWIQWLLFSVFSGLTLYFGRPPLRDWLKHSRKSGKVDSLMEETATALEDIPVAAMGRAELRGATWTARNTGDRPLARAERCKVEKVEGLTLHIRNI